MNVGAFILHDGLVAHRRLPLPGRLGQRVSLIELVVLFSLGAVTAMATSFLRFSLRIPGHSILLTVFPMALGLALVPRRWAGSIMGTSALVSAALFKMSGFGTIGAGAMTSMFLTGPFMDLALRGAREGPRLYLAFVLAGLGSNLVALGARALTKVTGLEPGWRSFSDWWPQALLSYALCGAIAGLVSALAWFHFVRGGEEPIRHQKTVTEEEL